MLMQLLMCFAPVVVLALVRVVPLAGRAKVTSEIRDQVSRLYARFTRDVVTR